MNNITLPHDVLYVLNRLKENNYSSYIVGGSLRDFFLGKEPSDWDICTNAHPIRIMQIINLF